MAPLLPFSRFGRFMLAARAASFRLLRAHDVKVDYEVCLTLRTLRIAPFES